MRTHHYIFFTIVTALVLSMLWGGSVVFADTSPTGTPLTNPLSSSDPLTILGGAINVVLGLVGSLALVVFLYGGFMWLISGGNSERVSQGTKAMLYAGIGIIVVFSSYAIITLILRSLGAVQ